MSSHNYSLRVIKQKIESNGHNLEVKGYSADGLTLSEFDDTPKSDDLFSFLIENNLNKYLFGVLSRIGSLDINNIPFREELLDHKKIEKTISESFIKKFECENCNHLLFRKHVDELDKYINKEYSCPICDKKYNLDYFDLKDDFSINRNDLIKYLEKLNKIDIVEKKLVYTCHNCVEYEDYNASKSLKCKKCGSNREIVYKYYFKDEFLEKNIKYGDGRWFEWYMFKICEHIFDMSEHNLMISFENTAGFKNTAEIDVVSLRDEELIIFECKDHLKGKMGLTDLQSLPKLSKLFKRIYLVSSHKEITKKKKEYINSLCDNEIEFIAGTSLEEQFLSEERVLDLFYDNSYKAISLYNKLNEIKRENILQNIISKIISEECKDENNLKSLLLIIKKNNERNDIINSNEDTIKTIIEYCLTNIYNETLVYASLNFIDYLLRIASDVVLSTINLDDIFSMGFNYLYIGFSNPPLRKRFINFYWAFNKINIDTTNITENVGNKFLKLFISVIRMYFGNDARISTLGIIKKFWNFADEECEFKLIQTIKNVLWDTEEVGYLNKKILVNFLVKHYPKFGQSNKNLVKEMFEEYIALKDRYEYYIYEEVKGALQELNS